MSTATLAARPAARARVRDGAFVLFAVLVVSQGAHLLEHTVQVVQWHVLGRSGDQAAGLLAFLDIEWVHYVWNTWILVATVPLLLRHRHNRWLWLALVAAAWHELEHAYLIFEYVRTGGLPGNPGLLAAGGALAGGTGASRIDLHFLYNVVETLPLFVAFAVVVRERRAAAAPPSPPGILRPLAWSALAGVGASAVLVGVAAAVAPDDYEGTVLAAYARDFPLAMGAPTHLPDGFHLVDGDGPWTTLDLDGDGHFETVRAEILYAPARTRGMPPLMMSMETQHDLSPLAGGYDRVVLPTGETGWLSIREDNDWDALLWNHGGLTFGIQAKGIPAGELLRIAGSVTIVAES